MQDTPLVCTLTASDYRDRERAWLKLGPYVRASTPVPGGQTFTFALAIGLHDSLAELVRLEGECCPWMSFAMGQSADGVQLTITTENADGERGIREAFTPLARA
jgi:hypothetical protein